MSSTAPHISQLLLTAGSFWSRAVLRQSKMNGTGGPSSAAAPPPYKPRQRRSLQQLTTASASRGERERERERESMAEEVKLHGMWASPFSLRVEWALRVKGVKYEYVDEDLLDNNKSPELLRYNPVHKKVPVLVHGGRPVAESLIIVEYIDEAWKDAGRPAILPADPYERAQARFWARFTDDKILPAVFGVYSKSGVEQQKAAEELKEHLSTLGGALGGRRLFGGATVGYVDITAGWLAYWMPMIEEVAGVSVVGAGQHPELSAWFEHLLSVEELKQCLPPKEKLYELNRQRRESLLAAPTGHP